MNYELMNYISEHWLDILTTVLGLVYILLEYRASIWLWFVGVVMPALDIWLYWSHGLYGDAGMAAYYTLAAIYGLWRWISPPTPRRGDNVPRTQTSDTTHRRKDCVPRAQTSDTTHRRKDSISRAQTSDTPHRGAGGLSRMPRRLYLPAAIFLFAAWGATYYVLSAYTDSTVPLLDAFTNAMSFVGLWALARKYIEQWMFWIVVDAICCYLYIVKGIPFKAALYGLYVVIAVAGYFKWKNIMNYEQ